MTLDIQSAQLVEGAENQPNHATPHPTGVPVTMRVKNATVASSSSM